MKQYTFTISVDEEQLKQAYQSDHNLKPDEGPDTESMILSELDWLNPSGISASGDIIDADRSIFIEWSIDDVRSRALERNLHLTDDECFSVLSSLDNNHDANLGITWHTLDLAIDLFS